MEVTEKAAREMRQEVIHLFRQEMRAQAPKGNLRGAIEWANQLAKAAHSYLRNPTPEALLEYHIAQCARVPFSGNS